MYACTTAILFSSAFRRKRLAKTVALQTYSGTARGAELMVLPSTTFRLLPPLTTTRHVPAVDHLFPPCRKNIYARPRRAHHPRLSVGESAWVSFCVCVCVVKYSYSNGVAAAAAAAAMAARKRFLHISRKAGLHLAISSRTRKHFFYSFFFFWKVFALAMLSLLLSEPNFILP